MTVEDDPPATDGASPAFDPARARKAAKDPHRSGERCRAPSGSYAPEVDRSRCEGKAECVAVCPYGVFEVRTIDDADFRALGPLARLKVWAHGKKIAYTPRTDHCQACGLCVVACPEKAITLTRAPRQAPWGVMKPAHLVSPLKLAGAALYIAVWPALLLVLAGDVRWVEGWLFAGWFAALCITVMVWLYRHDPALLAERYRRPGSGGQKGRDLAIVVGLVFGFAAWIVLMPLDARRFHWTPPPSAPARAVGGAFLLPAAVLLFRSFRDNTFLSPLVRIQTERKQQVVTTGVYGLVRHPMYLGAAIMFVGTPLMLGSPVGIAIGVAMTLLLAFRIVGEERVLASELEGYAAYRQKVPYRLVPYVW